MSESAAAGTLWPVLQRAAEEHGERVAFADQDERLSYRGLLRRATTLSACFCRLGLLSGQRISILADNQPNYLTSYFAAAGAGLVLNPLNVRLTLSELSSIVEHAQSRCLLADQTHRELASQLAARTGIATVVWIDGDHSKGVGWSEVLATDQAGFRVVDLDADQPAQLYYTSGTTGQPKGVILTHRNVVQHSRNAAIELDLCAADVWGHFAPLFHLADAWACFAITMVGAAHVFVPKFCAPAVLDRIAARGVSLTNLVPTMIVRLLAEQAAQARDLGSLRLLLSGGAPMAPALIEELGGQVGCEYAQTYGLTETSPYLTISRLGQESVAWTESERRAHTARTGRPFWGVDLEVVREDGTLVANDDCEVGEIRARGETVSPGYWQQPQETQRVFREGWFYTGDLAVVDQYGWLNIVDRKKDVILTGGETVYSTEVEHVLFEHQSVREAAVFGIPDEEWGERVTAAIVLRPGSAADASALQAHCRARLARYKLPREFIFLDELPRTGSGKIRKQSLRGKSN